ncbi:unnamed protein product, partial [marine sediment metagenome]
MLTGGQGQVDGLPLPVGELALAQAGGDHMGEGDGHT